MDVYCDRESHGGMTGPRKVTAFLHSLKQLLHLSTERIIYKENPTKYKLASWVEEFYTKLSENECSNFDTDLSQWGKIIIFCVTGI